MEGPMFVPGILVTYANTGKLYYVSESYGNGFAVCWRVLSFNKHGKPYIAQGSRNRYVLPTNRLTFQRFA